MRSLGSDSSIHSLTHVIKTSGLLSLKREHSYEVVASSEIAINNVECDLWEQMCEGSQKLPEVRKSIA